MDRTSLLFLILVIVLGGFIALYADRFGRELGKKRLRLAGLRPRRTAEIIVFSAGVLAPLLAILVLMAASAEARLWIAKGYRAVQEARNAEDARKRAIAQYELILTKSRQLESQIKDLELQQDQIRQQSEAFSKQAKQSEKDAKAALQKVSGLDRKVFELGGQVRTRQEQLTKVQTDLTSSQTRLSSLTQSYSTLQTQRDEANEEVERLGGDIASLEAQILSGKGDLSKLQGELTAKQIELREAEATYQEVVDRLNVDLEKLNGELRVAQAQISTARQYLQELAVKSLTERVIFQVGEEVVRLPVERQLSASEAQRALDTALRNARLVAKDRGARANIDGFEADLIDRVDPRITVAQQREAIIRALTGRGQESLLVISTPVNAFNDTFVPLDVQIFNNPIVFEEGELLGEERIDANASVGKIIEQVTNLLSTTVRKKAEERKMIIAAGGDGLGRIEPAEVYSMVSTVQNLQRVVRLQALAKTQTRAGGPLEIEFRFR
jgi:uncharacterized protein (DUF3084 family)